MTKRTPVLMTLAALAIALVLAACGGSSDETSGGGGSGSSGSSSNANASNTSGSKATLNLVAYSTPEVAYDDVIPDFEKTTAGQGIGFKSSYGASGDQSRAVAAGLPADIVALSLAPDVDSLVRAGDVAPDWADTPTKGMVTNSVVVFVVRRGNPKHIEDWSDLLKPGVEVLTPNPFSSGSAKWNMMAAYGQASDAGRNPQAGLDYLARLIKQHVKVQDRSGRDALQDFLGGNGDVSLSYENEAITAQRRGSQVDYVIPRSTLLIQNPIAVTTRSKDATAARAFVQFALSPQGQQDFANWGYRPVDRTVFARNRARFPIPSGLFTIDQLGGWTTVNRRFFDPEKGSITQIENQAGVSTAK